MASTYFSLILNKLDTLWLIDEGEHRDKLWQNCADAQMLEMFCWCLELETEEDYTGKAQMITHLNKIWLQVEEEEERWPQHIQDLNLLTFQPKIQQSKTQIQQWCQFFLRSSPSSMQSQMQCNSTTIHKILDTCENLLRYSRIHDSLFKNQIQILKNKLLFLSDSSERVDGCIDSKELVEYTYFLHAFSNNVLFLICMYWAKEENEENATGMNILLLDTLQKIKPCAAQVTASYFALLKSNNLIKENEEEDEDRQSPANFVDFFFEDTIWKDDFPSFREQLILLFKFLADVPHKKAEEEEVIRSQIYGLLQEDAYLLLPISQMMKEDFSNNNNLLTDFMDKIRVLSANIIQLYYTNYFNIYFESIRRELSRFNRLQVWSDSVDQCLNEITFLRSLFFQCFETWDDSDQETRLRLHSAVTSFHRIWGNEFDMGLLSGRLYAIRKEGRASADWRQLHVELKEKFRTSKQEINTWLLSLSHCSFHCRPSTSNKILKFLDSILHNMRGLGRATRPGKDVAFKKQTEILEKKLLLVKNLLELATNCVDSKNLEEFNILAQVFANNAACLIYLYWANWENDEFPGETNLMLCNMLLKIKPNTPHITRIYIGTLKAVCLQPYDSLLLRTVASFVDYFFEDLVVTPWKNDFQNLRDEVIFLLTFVHHHHTGNAEEIICSQLDVLFSDAVYGLLPFDDMKGDFSKKKVGLSDFLMHIGIENAKIRQLYCKFPDSFPMIIGGGFLDCLLQKLGNMTQRMISDQNNIMTIEQELVSLTQELVSLTPILNQILERTDLNDVWLEVVNVVYLAEHVTSFCFIYYHIISHYIPFLSDVVDRIKDVKKKFGKIKECNMSRCLPQLSGRMNTLLEQDWTSEMVGFERDEEEILNNITRGSMSLDIVSIVGMGGSGKTTLAKKVYGSSSVKSHFNIFAFSYVSQDHDKKKLLLDILSDIAGDDAETSCLTEDDLADKLRKRLSRQKYLIVLDDIWDINAWAEVKSSFPDNQNGSRVMFTTRSLEVAKRGQIKSCPHHISFLTDDESRKLLQKKIFHNELQPPNLSDLSDVVKLVAKGCKGLPLAIVVIAGVLSRTETSTWIEISKNVSSYLSNNEGCTGILELSYKNLPEYLKPCLLYLGAFPEDSSYEVRQVTLLWIAEGFIKESETKSLNDVAKEYLHELVNRSLLIVDEMTIGEIRSFRVHDLIHQLCRMKCGEKNFFKLGQGIATSSFSHPSIYDHYRISMEGLWDSTADAKLSLANTRSLLCLDYSEREVFLLRKLRFVQVLYLKRVELQESDLAYVTSLLDLRHIEVGVHKGVQSIPSSISNLWNMQSLILRSPYEKTIDMPETLWRMKSLRYVKVHDSFKFEVSDGYELQLDKVVSFSRPYLYSGKDVEWLLQRLPTVRKLSCFLDFERVEEKIDFHRKLESLKLRREGLDCLNIINFPSTLVKLTLEKFDLSWAAISAIAELQCLRILKLRSVSFPGPTWEMEDVTFPNLKYFELYYSNLELWNASTDSFPCLEQLYFVLSKLEELPSCFEETTSLKKITIWGTSKLESSAQRIREEQMELGNKVEVKVVD